MSDQINKLRSSNTAGRFKLLMKDSFVFGGLSAFTKFFSLFLTPILTRLLTKDQYGSMDILNPIMGIAATVIICGMDSAVARFYYKTEEVAERKQIISNGFWVQIIVSLFVTSLLFFFKKPLLEWYLGDSYHPVQESYLNMIILIILFSAPIRYAQNLLIWIFKRKQYVILSVGYISSNFIGMIVAIYLYEDKVLGVFVGQVIPALFFAGIALFFIKDNLAFKINKEVLFPMLKYGAPLLIVAFIPALVPSLDRFMINKYLGLSQVATYGIGYRVASLIAIPIMSINTALGPFMLALHKEKNAEKLFNLLAYCIIIFISILIMGMVIVAPYIIKILATSAYLPGLIVVIPLSFYFLTEMLRSIGAVGIDLSMKTYWNLILYPIALLILFSLLTIMTKHFGIVGAANALMVSSLLSFLIFTFVGTQLYPFKYNLFKKVMVLVFAYAFSLLILNFGHLLGNTLAFITLFTFVILSYNLFLTKAERSQIVSVIRTKFLNKG
ncbi:lipopolysaccharide biosynthesis protein [Pedobacter nyackensis]|uniref:Membrane protein involved in the export of O-antigen and teichoic acid n=1 Tax=Pedobacter nyackensis TaxID=475255 RepID=A0A1W2C1Q1_9SPHI|nr:oligosaccharide flippase family protein [Pedobacter nyackensis]SMC79109.1 Membrane protein involved in the export of O-antigen and teichoic acid [Pedobacter nyackensis]